MKKHQSWDSQMIDGVFPTTPKKSIFDAMSEDEWKRPKEVLKKAMLMKKNMLAKGLLRAKAKCPYCAGHWQAVLCGHKKHMHMACDGDCKSMLME